MILNLKVSQCIIQYIKIKNNLFSEGNTMQEHNWNSNSNVEIQNVFQIHRYPICAPFFIFFNSSLSILYSIIGSRVFVFLEMGLYRSRIEFLVMFEVVQHCLQGRIQDFKLGGGTHLKNCAERREARKFLGYFVWKITILRQKIIFFQF